MSYQTAHRTSKLLRMIIILIGWVWFVNKNYYYLQGGEKKATDIAVAF